LLVFCLYYWEILLPEQWHLIFVIVTSTSAFSSKYYICFFFQAVLHCVEISHISFIQVSWWKPFTNHITKCERVFFILTLFFVQYLSMTPVVYVCVMKHFILFFITKMTGSMQYWCVKSRRFIYWSISCPFFPVFTLEVHELSNHTKALNSLQMIFIILFNYFTNKSFYRLDDSKMIASEVYPKCIVYVCKSNQRITILGLHLPTNTKYFEYIYN